MLTELETQLAQDLADVPGVCVLISAEVLAAYPVTRVADPYSDELGHIPYTQWQPKSENLRALAAELGLGLDSFIFLDDNPLECAEVQAQCPDVLTLPLPTEPSRWPHFLAHVWTFDHLQQTVFAGDFTIAELARVIGENQVKQSETEDVLALLEKLGELSDEQVKELLAREETIV